MDKKNLKKFGLDIQDNGKLVITDKSPLRIRAGALHRKIVAPQPVSPKEEKALRAEMRAADIYFDDRATLNQFPMPSVGEKNDKLWKYNPHQKQKVPVANGKLVAVFVGAIIIGAVHAALPVIKEELAPLLPHIILPFPNILKIPEA